MKLQKFMYLLALLLLTLPWSSANEFDNMPEVKAITKGQPKEVTTLIGRIAECNHWGSEEPYDKARAEEIGKAIKKAKCDRLDSDELAIKKKHKGNNKVSEAIDQAKTLGI